MRPRTAPIHDLEIAAENLEHGVECRRSHEQPYALCQVLLVRSDHTAPLAYTLGGEVGETVRRGLAIVLVEGTGTHTAMFLSPASDQFAL